MIVSNFIDGTNFILMNDNQELADIIKSKVDDSINFSNNAKYPPDSKVLLNCSEEEFIKEFSGTYNRSECIMIYRSIVNQVGIVLGSTYSSDGVIVIVDFDDIGMYSILEHNLKGRI